MDTTNDRSTEPNRTFNQTANQTVNQTMGVGCQPSVLESTAEDSEIRSDSACESKVAPDLTMDITSGVGIGASMVETSDDSISFHQTIPPSETVKNEQAPLTESVGEETKLLETSKDVQISKQVRTEDESGLLKVKHFF